jgi:polyhydroxyalkanoate synthesis regulator phasin
MIVSVDRDRWTWISGDRTTGSVDTDPGSIDRMLKIDLRISIDRSGGSTNGDSVDGSAAIDRIDRIDEINPIESTGSTGSTGSTQSNRPNRPNRLDRPKAQDAGRRPEFRTANSHRRGDGMSEEQKRRPGIGEGIRSGIGVLTAVKEAIEETIREAGDRGDLKPERARQFLNEALGRAQDAVGDVRERLDFVPRKEFDDLKAEVEALRARLDVHSGQGALPTSATAGGEGPTEARMP